MRILAVAIASSIVGLGLLVSSGDAQAATNLVTNGSFEQTTNGGGQLGDNGTGNTSVTGWSVPAIPNSYNFVFTPNSSVVSGTTADSTGVNGPQYGNLKLWGPGDGSNNGLRNSPDGGNFLAIDSAFQNNGSSSISQTVNGLVSGGAYVVSFYDAAAQQSGFTGSTFDQFQVSLGGQTQKATNFSNLPSEGFSGWKAESLTFKATSSSELLNFLATGGPTGVPPFLLLDGVSVAPVPEPSFVWGLSAIVAFGLSAGLKAKLAINK